MYTLNRTMNYPTQPIFPANFRCLIATATLQTDACIDERLRLAETRERKTRLSKRWLVIVPSRLQPRWAQPSLKSTQQPIINVAVWMNQDHNPQH
jgi:hypothetical protein